LGIPSDAQLVAAIGQISLRKGQDILIQAAIDSAAALPTAHWLVIGERYSAKQETIEFEAALHRQVSSAGLEDRVHWLGYRDDVAKLLPEIDLLVHPARQEPLGRVLLEAAACRVPIIATTVGGTEEILDQNSAVLIRPDDPSALADAVRSLLADKPRCVEIGRQARQRALTCFGIEDRANELARHWRQLLQ
jgi:glycosyltransferase involved in cell wall biosynthesis